MIPTVASTTARPGARSTLATVALVCAAVSLVGMIGLLVGHLVDPKDFNNKGNNSTLDNVFFFMYFPGLVLAALSGGTAWFAGRRSRRAGDIYAGKIVLGYVVVGIIAAVLVSSIG